LLAAPEASQHPLLAAPEASLEMTTGGTTTTSIAAAAVAAVTRGGSSSAAARILQRMSHQGNDTVPVGNRSATVADSNNTTAEIPPHTPFFLRPLLLTLSLITKTKQRLASQRTRILLAEEGATPMDSTPPVHC